MNNGQETPYQVALREHLPLANGIIIMFRSNIPGNRGEIIGHSATYENNVFQQWVYTVVPFGMRQNGHILCTVEVPADQIL